MLDGIIEFIFEHPVVSLIVLFFIIGWRNMIREDKRKYESQMGMRTQDLKAWGKGQVQRNYEQEKDDTILATVGLIIVGVVIYNIGKWIGFF